MILRMADVADGNGFVATLPEDLRKEPSLATFKDVGTLAKSYVEAQKLIGSKRIAIPGDKAPETEWNQFYSSLGRPETHDKYEVPDIKLEEGVAFDEKKLDAVKQHFHKLGLTPKQAHGAMEYYLNHVNETVKTTRGATEAAHTAAIAELQKDWGDSFETNVDIARGIIKKFGGEHADELQKFLNDSGLGNNSRLIKLFHKIGTEFLEDTGRRGGGSSGTLPMGDQSRAQLELQNLKLDNDFQKALGDPRHPGHGAALERWINIHKVAHPGQVKD